MDVFGQLTRGEPVEGVWSVGALASLHPAGFWGRTLSHPFLRERKRRGVREKHTYYAGGKHRGKKQSDKSNYVWLTAWMFTHDTDLSTQAKSITTFNVHSYLSHLCLRYVKNVLEPRKEAERGSHYSTLVLQCCMHADALLSFSTEEGSAGFRLLAEDYLGTITTYGTFWQFSQTTLGGQERDAGHVPLANVQSQQGERRNCYANIFTGTCPHQDSLHQAVKLVRWNHVCGQQSTGLWQDEERWRQCARKY